MKIYQINCNHRSDDNSVDSLKIMDQETGDCFCTKCGCNFRSINISSYKDCIDNYTSDDILNSFKVMAFDNPIIISIINKRLSGIHCGILSYSVSEDLYDFCVSYLNEKEIK